MSLRSTGKELKTTAPYSSCRKGQDGTWEDWKDFENRQLLWHGSRLTNWMGILSQGLRIAPPEAPGNQG